MIEFDDNIRQKTRIAVYSLLSLVAFILLRLNAFGYGIMLAYALYSVIIVKNNTPYIYLVTFILSGVFFGASELLLSVLTSLPLIVFRIVVLTKRLRIKYFFYIILGVLGTFFYLALDLDNIQELFLRLLGVLIYLAFGYICDRTLKLTLKHNRKQSLSIADVIILCVFWICVVKGLTAIEVFGFNLVRFVLPVIVLCCAYVFNGQGALICAVSAGIGCAIDFDMTYISVISVWCLVAVAFINHSKYLSMLALIMADITMLIVFSYIPLTIQAVSSTTISALLFILVPTSFLDRLKFKYTKTQRFSSQHIINRLKNSLSDRLYKLSEIFFSMELTFKSMVKGVFTKEVAVHEISKEVSQSTCQSCPEKIKCWHVNTSQTEKSFGDLVSCALTKGRVSVLDIDSLLSSRCSRLNSLLANVNQQAINYKHYYSLTTTSNNSKMLIGEQLGGVSKLLAELSKESKTAVSFDNKKEQALILALNEKNILVKEAVFYGEGSQLNLTIVVDFYDSKNPRLMEYINEFLGSQFMVDRAENTENRDWRVLHIKPQPRFDVLFGFQAVKKHNSTISGDSHSFTKLSNDKFMLAICDGMGSGEKAEEISNRAISIVENFYKAGFQNDIILSSVNKLLAFNNDELFSAIDICVINLSNGSCDLVKLGSPASIVKIENEFCVLEGNSLPLGVLDNITPNVYKKYLNVNDLIIIFSDGVEEAFHSNQNLMQFVDAQADLDPQLLANNIIKQALENNPQPADDMTVIVAKIA